MNVTTIILVTVVTLVAVGASVSAYYGTFKKLTIEVKEAGGETIVFEEIKGDYRQSGVVMDKIYYSLLNDDEITTYKGFGTYYDNPKKVKTEDLRSEAGSILESSDLDKVNELRLKYNIKNLPKEEYIVTEFPYKNTMSVFFSLMKVYPALTKYAKENNHREDTPVTEIYDIPNNKIIYLKKLTN